MRNGLTDMPAMPAMEAVLRKCRRDRSKLFIMGSLKLRTEGWRCHREINRRLYTAGKRGVNCVLVAGWNRNRIDCVENLAVECAVHFAGHQEQIDAIEQSAGRGSQAHF